MRSAASSVNVDGVVSIMFSYRERRTAKASLNSRRAHQAIDRPIASRSPVIAFSDNEHRVTSAADQRFERLGIVRRGVLVDRPIFSSRVPLRRWRRRLERRRTGLYHERALCGTVKHASGCRWRLKGRRMAKTKRDSVLKTTVRREFLERVQGRGGGARARCERMAAKSLPSLGSKTTNWRELAKRLER